MKTNFKYSVLMAAISAFLAMPDASQAQDIPEALHKNLKKKYKTQMKVAVDYESGRFVTEPIGVYIFRDFFNDVNASPLGRATKRVRKFCEEEQSGVFNQIAKIQPNYTLSVDPITFQSDGKTHSYAAKDLFKYSYASDWPAMHEERYLRLSNVKGKLGIFSCQDVRSYTKTKGLGDTTLFKKDIVLLPLDVKNFEAIKASQELVEQVEERFKNEKNQERSDFESSLDIGSETSCGMVIGKRGSIFEIDLKPSAARSSGKSVAWLKVDKIEQKGAGCRL